MYTVILSKRACKDRELLKAAKLSDKARILLDIISIDPFTNPPPYESLVGQLQGIYSRRINIQHRLIYTVDENAQTIHVLRMWTHYE